MEGYYYQYEDDCVGYVYEYTEHVLEEDTPASDTERIKYTIQEWEDKAIIKKCELLGQDSSIMNMLAALGIVYFSVAEDQGEDVVLRKLPEMDVTWEDYEVILDIYLRLIRMGIVVEQCTFVRTKNGDVKMQLPRGIMVFRTENGSEIVRNEYKRGLHIDNSFPFGVDCEWIKHNI